MEAAKEDTNSKHNDQVGAKSRKKGPGLALLEDGTETNRTDRKSDQG